MQLAEPMAVAVAVLMPVVVQESMVSMRQAAAVALVGVLVLLVTQLETADQELSSFGIQYLPLRQACRYQ
jgi:hypothetical protein